VRELIPASLAGERLDRLVSIITGRSRSEAAALVAAGAVRVGGEVVTSGKVKVVEGDEVEVDPGPEPGPVVEADASVVFTVVHEDDDVLVVDKPAGLVVHPGAGNITGTMVHGLVARYPEIAGVGDADRPGIVHRLDRDTSGLLVVARTEAARGRLVSALAARHVDRVYLALVQGCPESDAGLVDAPLGRSTRTPTKMTVSERGKEARTRYEVLQRWPDPGCSLLRCTLETGRTHQIRVHLAAIGHPVVGDDAYDRGHKHPVEVPRLFLHATRLAFDHPITGEHLTFDSPLPSDLAQVLEGLPPAT
jgi:23S rRNA pseudouridine1911/1915/1917 synthase